MTELYPLQLSDVRQETEDCRSLAFAIPQNLQEKFKFVQGQYLTLQTKINGEDVRRSYSICSSPLDQELRVAVKLLPGGKFSTFANEVLKVGDELLAMPPMGNFYTDLDPQQSKHYFCLAAGSGITPMMSIIKTTLETEPNSQVTLLYGNKNTRNIIFHEQLEGLKNKYLERFTIIYILSREKLDEDILFGRIDAQKFEAISQTLVDLNTVDECFLCGPESMILALKEGLANKGIPQKNIHFELFGTNQKGQKKPEIKKENQGKAAKVEVRVDGRSFVFDLPFGQDNLLDASMKEGADLPFACKGGVCCTCKARLKKGEVEMMVNYALEPEEVADGLILSCQAYPKSEEIMLDFDDI